MEELRKQYESLLGKSKYQLDSKDLSTLKDLCRSLNSVNPHYSFNCNACSTCNFNTYMKKAKQQLGF